MIWPGGVSLNGRIFFDSWVVEMATLKTQIDNGKKLHAVPSLRLPHDEIGSTSRERAGPSLEGNSENVGRL